MNRFMFKKVYCEISNSCNLKCGFCPSAADSPHKKRFMDEPLFARLAPQLSGMTRLLCLHLMGEPLTHPKLERFLDICSVHNLRVSMVTNGTLLHVRHQRLLVHPAVAQIHFSLQSFEANFPTMDNGQYLAAIFGFCRHATANRPDLTIHLRLWNADNFASSMQRNRTTIQRIQDGFAIPDAAMAILSDRDNRIGHNLHLHFADRFDWPGPDLPFQGRRGSCLGLKHQFGILSDGTVVPCCLDKAGQIALGNGRERPISEILTSERAVGMRNGFRHQQLVEPLCQHCTYHRRFSAVREHGGSRATALSCD